MLKKYSPQILERQITRFPEYIAQLETLAKGLEGPIQVGIAVVLHGMRNDLAIVAMVLELQAVYEADKVPSEVI